MGKGKRGAIVRWGGIMAHTSRLTRIATFAILAVASVSLTFVQWGFIGIGEEGAYDAYAIGLLAPIALGALMLGILPGGLIGAIAGGALYVHAQVQPLDFYEMLFITPYSSIALFAITGLLLGWLFAIALRKDPPPWRRFIYIVIVCWIVSILFSDVFTLMALFSTVLDMDLTEANLTDRQIGILASRIGDPDIQKGVDWLAMIALSFIADIAVRIQRRHTANHSLRTMFRVWLAVVAGIAFMITGAIGFVAITNHEMNEEHERMEGELDYLASNIRRMQSGANALIEALMDADVNMEEISNEQFDAMINSMSLQAFLEGYTKEDDGTVIITYGEYVSASNDPSIESGVSSIRAILGDDLDEPLAKLADGDMLQIIYDDIYTGFEDDSASETGDNASGTGDDASGTSDGVSEASNAASETGEDAQQLGGDSSELDSDKMISTQIAFMCGTKVDDGRSAAPSSSSDASASSASSDGEQIEPYYVFMIAPSSIAFKDRPSVMVATTASVFVLLAVVFLVVALLLNRVVVRRIDDTNTVLAQITDGNLDARVDIHDSREFESLSNGINATVGALKEWIGEAETRMDRELATAKAIQESALPRIFPPFPDNLHFDIYASMNAAREVGGDFYDFFLVGDDSDSDAGKLGFVVADVSGKGVPAALFMMTAKTLVRNFIESGMELSEAVENANRQLCDGNDAGMFVTLFVGVLDYSTGHVDYVNAGHNPPLLWEADLPESGAWRWVEDKSGIPLGLFDGMPYEAFQTDLQIGSQFVLYTDGVTEAMNVSGELYGEQRLLDLVEGNAHLHPRPLIQCIREDLAAWTVGAEQSDDITMLVLEYGVPPELTATLIVPADTKQLDRVNDFVHGEMDRRLCPVRAQNQLDIALEELFVNVCHYAYPDATPEKPGIVRISRTYSADPPSITVEIADDGIPYNPLAKPDAVTPDNIVDVPIGGLGILMAKNSVDEMTYEYVDGSNVVTIMKKW